MATAQDLARTPPAPRSLRSIKGARLELARLYAQTKLGTIEPTVAGRLAHILGLLIGSYRDHEFEARLDALERAAAEHGPQPRSNGHGRTYHARP